MINNNLALGLLLSLAGCRTAAAQAPSPFQGIVELEETPVAFELGGRITEILVRQGDQVAAGAGAGRVGGGLDRPPRAGHAREGQGYFWGARGTKSRAPGGEKRALPARG